jgi:hydroxymethylpyrimidine/phosphomethylpyrimidine kinase
MTPLLDGICGDGVALARHSSSPKSQPGKARETPPAKHTLAERAMALFGGESCGKWKILPFWKECPMTSISPIALTIAGFDPSSGAGITADLKTFSAHGIYGVACISALTVQSTLGVRSMEPLPALLVRQTLACLAEDVAFSGIKIGMLGSSAVAAEVASFLTAIPLQRIVLDPVLRSSSGKPLMEPDGVRVMREELLPRVGWITPNLEELAILTDGPVERDEIPSAALRLKEIAARWGNDELNVVVTGGHLERPDDFLLTAAGEQTWLQGEKIVTNATHGTGCAFSSALLSALISGQEGVAAAAAAKVYVTGALRAAYPVGKGQGPMNHFFKFLPV